MFGRWGGILSCWLISAQVVVIFSSLTLLFAFLCVTVYMRLTRRSGSLISKRINGLYLKELHKHPKGEYTV